MNALLYLKAVALDFHMRACLALALREVHLQPYLRLPAARCSMLAINLQSAQQFLAQAEARAQMFIQIWAFMTHMGHHCQPAVLISLELTTILDMNLEL